MSGETRLKHAGVREVETALAHPDSPTQHFPPVVIQNVFNAPVGSFQAGAGSIANVVQNVGPAVDEVARLIAEIRRGLPADRPELAEALADVEAEAKAQEPRKSVIRSSLAFLWTAAKDIATLGQFVVQLAQVYGVKLPGQ